MSTARSLYLRLFERREVTTPRGNGILIKSGVDLSFVSINGKITELESEYVVPVAMSLKEMGPRDYNHIGNLLSDGMFKSFNREIIRTTGRDVVIAFEAKSNDITFGYEINPSDGSINSSYQIKNVFAAYLYLIENGYDVSNIGRNVGFGHAKWP